MIRSSIVTVPAPLTSRILLEPRVGRTGVIVFNDTPSDLLLVFDDALATPARFTASVQPGQEWRLCSSEMHEGHICAALLTPATASGTIHVTETYRA